MKKKIYKYIAAFAVLCLVFLSVCKTVDMHRDGAKLRDGRYYFYARYASGSQQLVWDVNYGMEAAGTNVQLWTENYGASQQFYLSNEGENTFCILFGENGLCVGENSDAGNVEVQQYTGDYNQLWRVERVGHTQYFTFQNIGSGLYAEYVKSETEKFFNIEVNQFTEDDMTFYFMLVK